eukprot:TRINITY_DN52110_c0_g1_i1.p1 TRINITY_DN52110_c0_g1~~TRINITY_DN52110_c0_g1_i1.p1  ORF type:complete len:280 (+),score=35.21 TRINITY_DN52110_c0_g1_i1:54-842(+)
MPGNLQPASYSIPEGKLHQRLMSHLGGGVGEACFSSQPCLVSSQLDVQMRPELVKSSGLASALSSHSTGSWDLVAQDGSKSLHPVGSQMLYSPRGTTTSLASSPTSAAASQKIASSPNVPPFAWPSVASFQPPATIPATPFGGPAVCSIRNSRSWSPPCPPPLVGLVSGFPASASRKISPSLSCIGSPTIPTQWVDAAGDKCCSAVLAPSGRKGRVAFQRRRSSERDVIIKIRDSPPRRHKGSLFLRSHWRRVRTHANMYDR